MRVVLQIRAGTERKLRPGRRPNRRLAQFGAGALQALTVFCVLVCGWRWSYELGWTRQFLVTAGVWTHWQIWFLAGCLAQGSSMWLSRYAAATKAEARVPQERHEAPIR